MGLSFLSPFFLLGLAAAAIPIIIHRLSQRRAVVRKFSAVRLLLLSQQRVTRPLKLKHLLLLALRILVIASLVFMVARPILVSGSKALGTGANRALGLILDNSASMGYRAEWGERFALGKKAAKALIEALGPNGQAIVLGTVRRASEPKLVAGREALAQVEAISLSYGSSDYGQAFREVYQALEPSRREKEIVLVTDLARGDWERFSLAQLEKFDPAIGMKVLRLGKETRDDNLAVTGLKPPDLVVAGVPTVLEATLANLSSKAQDRVVAQLFLDGNKVDQKAVNLKPMDKATVNFEARFVRPGWVKGEVRVSEDRLPFDDKFHFALKAQEKVRALLVDGDPRTALKAGETYFLVNALNPERSAEEAAIAPKVIGPEELAGVDLSPYRVVILCNVGAISSSVASKLFQFVKAGNSLVIFGGDKVSAESYNQLFYDSDTRLLPARLKQGVVDAGPSGQRIGKVAYAHPALSIFQRDQAGGLFSAGFYRYLALEATSSALITFANGAPFLLEGQVGQGRVLLFTSSADAEWNDLTLKASYLPLMQSLVQYGAGLDGAKEKNSIFVGQPMALTAWAKEAGKPARVTDPQGSETSLLLRLNGEKAGATFVNNLWPGVYKAVLAQTEFLYAVNVPSEESDLGKLSKEELAKKLGSVPLEVVEYRTEADLAGLYGTRKELWPYFLLFIILLMVGESVLANRL